MAQRKVNDNGSTPPFPNQPDTKELSSDAILREIHEDMDLAEAKQAASQGLCRDYTKAPWRVGMAK